MTARSGLFVFLVWICPAFILGADPEPHVVRVWFPRFSADSKWLATAHGSWDQKDAGEVRLWNAATGELKHTLKQPRGIRSVAFSPKSTLLAAGGYGNVILIIDPESGKILKKWSTPTSVQVLVFHPDEQRVISGHGNGSIHIWNVVSAKEVMAIPATRRGEIWGMALSSDGKLLATAGQGGYVRIIDVAEGRILHELKHPRDTNGVAFTSDGKQLATGCGDSLIRLFDVDKGTELLELHGHQGGGVTDLQFGPKDQVLLSSGIDRTVRVWDFSDPKSPVVKQTLRGHDQFVFGVAMSPNGKLLASASWDDRIKVWDLEAAREKWSWDRDEEKK
jgi:WD40 repeat protein